MHSNDDLSQAFLEVLVEVSDRIAAYQDRAQWEAYLPSQQRTVGQLFDHIAWAWEAESAAFRAIADGASGSDLTGEWLDAQNAEQARLSAGRGPDQTRQRVQDAGERTLAFIQGLNVVQRQRRGTHMPGEPERTVAEWIEVCLIGHPREHLAEIEAASHQGVS